MYSSHYSPLTIHYSPLTFHVPKLLSLRMLVLPDNNPEWHSFGHLFKQQSVAARTIFVTRRRNITQSIILYRKGCIRLWFNNNGKDVTFQFFWRWRCFFHWKLSHLPTQPFVYDWNHRAMWPLHTITQKISNIYSANSPAIRKQIEEHNFRRLILYQKLFSRIKNTPQQRYEELLKSYPKMLQRIPQHYIVYLGITAVSLSRIRNRK